MVNFQKAVREQKTETHGEVFAADIQGQTHVQELLHVEAVQQDVHTHVPQGTRLQNVAQEFHITEGVHHYHQGLRMSDTKEVWGCCYKL